MKKKKILYVVEAMGGGVFTYIVELSNELVKQYDMYVAYGTRPQTPQNYKEYFDERVKLIEVKNFTRSINILKDLKSITEIRRIAKNISPDIIHLHSSKAGVIGRIAFNGKRMPLFYTPHGYSFLMENYDATKRFLFKAIENILGNKICTTVACSYGEYQEALKLTTHATYISNGINTEELDSIIQKIENEEKRDELTVYTLGRICYQKNPRLFNEIAERMPNLHFLWIGDGELRSELRSDNIEITGWIDREDALQRCSNSDVFLLTSLWEGLPISLLESMYMKKLAVVSDVIGNHDVIRNRENGFVCENIEEFVNAINATDTDNMIEQAYKEVQEKYNTLSMAGKYIKIYQDTITKNR